MEYNIYDFVIVLRNEMYKRFPNLVGRGFNYTGSPKHGKHNQEIRDVAFDKNPTNFVTDNMISFDIGNDFAEKYYPYYHILQDSPVIHKREKGTTKSKGSQAEITELSKRDYGIVMMKCKTFSKEYTRNIRGARKQVVDKSQRIVNGVKIHETSNTYKNIHYQYIDKLARISSSQLAIEFDLKLLRPTSSGLVDDYVSQDYDEPLSYDDSQKLVSAIMKM